MTVTETPAQGTPAAGEPAKETPAATPAAEGAPSPAVAAAAAPTEEKPVAEKPVVPQKYELKLPEGSQLDQARIDSLSAYAKEKGLSNEQAQAILDRESDAVSS